MFDEPSEARSDARLAFFGRIAANLSHELANAVGTLCQATGLLDDLLRAAEGGVSLDVNRLKVIEERLDRQAFRAADLIEQLNYFAHTVDSTEVEVDLASLARNLVAISRRPAGMTNVALALEPVPQDMRWRGDPFGLLEALVLALECFYEDPGSGGHVTISVVGTPAGIRIKSAGALERAGDRIGRVQALATRLGARAALEHRGHSSVFFLALD